MTILSSARFYSTRLGGWIRDLNREYVEPNPGPLWDQLIDMLRKNLTDDFGEIEPTLGAIKREIEKNPRIGLVTTDHVAAFLKDEEAMKAIEWKEGITEAIEGALTELSGSSRTGNELYHNPILSSYHHTISYHSMHNLIILLSSVLFYSPSILYNPILLLFDIILSYLS